MRMDCTACRSPRTFPFSCSYAHSHIHHFSLFLSMLHTLAVTSDAGCKALDLILREPIGLHSFSTMQRFLRCQWIRSLPRLRRLFWEALQYPMYTEERLYLTCIRPWIIILPDFNILMLNGFGSIDNWIEGLKLWTNIEILGLDCHSVNSEKWTITAFHLESARLLPRTTEQTKMTSHRGMNLRIAVEWPSFESRAIERHESMRDHRVQTIKF